MHAEDPTLTQTTSTDWILYALLVLATWFLYLPAGGHEFIWYDDGSYLLDNSQVYGGFSWESVRWAFTQSHSANWHPLTWLSHMLDCELFGLDAGGHHLMAAGIHSLNTLLCFLVLRAAMGSRWPSAICAALFGLHPLRVQSVAWASERKDLLAGLFFFLCLWSYIRYARRPSKLAYTWVALTLTMGLMSKPMLVTLPLLLLFFDIWPLERLGRYSWRRLVLEKVPLLALVGLSIVITILAQGKDGAFQFALSLPFSERIPHAASSVLQYVRASFWPEGLTIFYPHPGLVNADWNPWFLSLLPFSLGLAFLLLLKRSAKCCPELLFGSLWMLLMLAPVIGIVQVGEQSWADRYAYLPTIGLYIAVVWPLSKWARANPVWRLPLSGLAVAAILSAGWRSTQELPHWQDSTSLATRSLEVTENNHVAHLGLGFALLEQGDYPAAEQQFQAAQTIYPESTDVVLAYSKLYQATGRHKAAVALYREALLKHPEWVTIRMRLGNALAQSGSAAEAIEHLEQAIELNREHSGLSYNLALAYLQNGQPSQALPLLDVSLQQSPKLYDARIARGEAHFQLRHYAAAKRDLLRGARIAPDRAAARLALLLASAPSPSLRNGQEALTWATKAIQANPTAEAYEALAAAQAELGRFDDAQETQQKAIKLFPKRRRQAAEARLLLYLNAKPFRLPAGPQ